MPPPSNYTPPWDQGEDPSNSPNSNSSAGNPGGPWAPGYSPHDSTLWTAVTISTSFAVLYGLFLNLAVVSVYLLLRRGVRRRPLNAIQLFAVTALFVSTTTHWAVDVLQRFGGMLSDPTSSTSRLVNLEAFLPEECIGTATLTVNLILSDVVVWWRVLVLWQDSRVRYRRMVAISGGILLVATFITGTLATNSACHAKGGFMYEGSLVGTAVPVLSLATNLAATTLTAYKAWVHRRCIQSYVASGSRSTQVESIFALLIESGMLYCSLWVVVAVWQIGSRIYDPYMRSAGSIVFKFLQPVSDAKPSFWFRGGVLIEGCLVPLIAIYPTAIIVLVALNKSAVENGLRRDPRSGGVGAATAIAVTVETVVDRHTDSDAENDMAGDSRSDFHHSEKK